MARCARSIHRWAIKARLSPEARLLISGQAPARLATYLLDSNAPRWVRIMVPDLKIWGLAAEGVQPSKTPQTRKK